MSWVGTGSGPPASTVERRSPDAAAHDPRVRRVSWTTDRSFSAAGFAEEIRRRAELTEEEWERLRRHAGAFVDRIRWEGERAGNPVERGSVVTVYCYEEEPRRITLPPHVVLFDEGGLVAVDKPPWFTTQGSRASRLSSLERALRERLSCPELRPCNRLDRETSGVVLFARDGRAASLVGKQLERRTVRKEYLAVVSPPPRRTAWEVAGRLVRTEHPLHSAFDHVAGDAAEGRPALTRFEGVEGRGSRALVRAFPVTGRTHQIRVHLAASGCPIVGDSIYGSGWRPGEHATSASRLQLHALSVTLRTPIGERTIEASPPADFGLSAR